MTVADLIRELQAMPNQAAPVRLILRRVWVQNMMGGYEPYDLDVSDVQDDSAVADGVNCEGSYVLVWSK